MRVPDPVLDGRALVRLGSADRGLYCRLYGCADTMRRVGAALTEAQAGAAFDRVIALLEAQPGRYGYWLLPRGGGARESGGIMALLGDASGASAEVGVLLAPSAQRSGVATAAIDALAHAVFSQASVQRLWTRHAQGHDGAAALMRRTGFASMPPTPDGLCRWELTRGDWLARAGPGLGC